MVKSLYLVMEETRCMEKGYEIDLSEYALLQRFNIGIIENFNMEVHPI